MFVPVGSNPARVFGLDARTRACRLATKAGLECGDSIEPGHAVLVASLDYAWDPAWLKGMMIPSKENGHQDTARSRPVEYQSTPRTPSLTSISPALGTPVATAPSNGLYRS